MAFTNLAGQPDDDQIADINVVPFVDIVLVLLIIFMITAGVVEFGLQIDVPRTKEVAATAEDYQFINITDQGELFFNDDAINLYDIVPKLKSLGDEVRPGVYVRAHKTVPWETLAQVVAECGAGGVQVHLVTKPLERNPRGR